MIIKWFFCKGSCNTIVDALLRKPYASLNAIFAVTNNLLQRIKHSWLKDTALVHLIHKLKNFSVGSSKYRWQGDQFRQKGKLAVGQDIGLRDELLSLFHNSPTRGHAGAKATMKR